MLPRAKSQDSKISFDHYSFELKMLKWFQHHRRMSNYLLVVGMLLNIAGFVLSIRGKFVMFHIDQFKYNVVILIRTLCDFSLSLSQSVSIFLVVRSDFLLELITYLTRCDGIVPNKPKTIMRTTLTIVRVVPLIPISVGIYLFGSNLGWSNYVYYLPNDVWNYMLNWNVCCYVTLVALLKRSFHGVNEYLKQLDREAFDPNSYLVKEFHTVAETANKEAVKAKNLRELTTHHNALCNYLDKFNSHEKVNLVVTTMCLTLNILSCLTVSIEQITRSSSVLDDGAKLSLYVFEGLLILTTVGQAAVAAYVGESLEEEGERTSRICFTLLNQLNSGSLSENDALIVNELKFLLDQSRTRKICLHAGGFLKMNWGILGSIISTVATYSIVIIQFLLNK